MRSVLSLAAPARRHEQPGRSGRPPEADELCFSEELVTILLEEYTRPGDLVLDPFAGFGTTLVVAERMGRRPLGIEIIPERAEYARSQLTDPSTVLAGDARRLDEYALPAISLVVTSPPYMTHVEHPQNPLSGYQTLDGDYARYLDELASTFGRIGNLLVPGGRVVLNVSNLRVGEIFTPLAWDVGRAVLAVLPFEREVFVDRDQGDERFTGDYLLVFGGTA